MVMQLSPSLIKGVTLIELVVVLGIVAILVTLAVPSWHAFQAQATENEARVVLQRLALAQRMFRLRHQRYAMSGELPALNTLSPHIARRYHLRVDLPADGYDLQLLSDQSTLASFSVNHVGLWREFGRDGLDAGVGGAPLESSQ